MIFFYFVSDCGACRKFVLTSAGYCTTNLIRFIEIQVIRARSHLIWSVTLLFWFFLTDFFSVCCQLMFHSNDFQKCLYRVSVYLIRQFAYFLYRIHFKRFQIHHAIKTCIQNVQLWIDWKKTNYETYSNANITIDAFLCNFSIHIRTAKSPCNTIARNSNFPILGNLVSEQWCWLLMDIVLGTKTGSCIRILCEIAQKFQVRELFGHTNDMLNCSRCTKRVITVCRFENWLLKALNLEFR